MVMWTRMYLSMACLGLLCFCVRIDFAQTCGPQTPALYR